MHRFWTPLGVAAVLAMLLQPMNAAAISHTPSISGNGWVAMALLIGFIVMIVMVVFGALHIEKRDARLGRRRRGDGALFPFPHGSDDDEDGHHHGN